MFFFTHLTVTSRPRVCKQRVLDKEIMSANVIFHVDGNFVANRNLAWWAFALFTNRVDFLCEKFRALIEISLKKLNSK